MLIVEKSTPLDSASGDGGQAGVAPGVCTVACSWAGDARTVRAAGGGRAAFRLNHKHASRLMIQLAGMGSAREMRQSVKVRPREEGNARQFQTCACSMQLGVQQDVLSSQLLPTALTAVPARPKHCQQQVGKLNLVDLAGSERVHVTGATGKRLEESKKINQVGKLE